MSIYNVAAPYADAWSSGQPDAVASFYSADDRIIINRRNPVAGHAALRDMVAGFHGEFPGLPVRLDHLRAAGEHVTYS